MVSDLEACLCAHPDAAKGDTDAHPFRLRLNLILQVDDQQSVDYDLRGLSTVLLEFRSRPDCALGD